MGGAGGAGGGGGDGPERPAWLSPESFATASAAELTDAARQLHGLVSATHAQLLAVIAAVDERRCYVEDGATSAAAWLVGLLGISSERAGRWVRVARELAAATPLAEAYAAGSLSFDQLRPALALVEAELSREDRGDAASGETPTGADDESGEDAARREEETEARRRRAREEAAARWADLAPGYAASSLALLARRARGVSLLDANEAHRRRCVHLRPVGQAWRLVGLLPDAEGAAVAERLAALAGRLAEEERAAEAEAGLERVPLAARMADALVALVTKDVGDEATAERAMVVVHVDATLLAGGSGLAELEAGPALAAETAARLACDASVQVSIDNAAGEAIGLGRRSRSVPPWLSRQLRLRDGHCRFPGCERRRFAQAHHLRHWGKGGPTDPANLVLLCSTHHRLCHEGGWRIEGSPNAELVFTSGERRLASRPVPLRPEVATRFLCPPGAAPAKGNTSSPPEGGPPGAGSSGEPPARTVPPGEADGGRARGAA